MKSLLAAFAIALCANQVLFAADVERYGEFNPSASESEWWLASYPAASLSIIGTIKEGDFEKLTRALGNHGYEQNRWSIHLNSEGGDVREAMRMGRLLRQGLFEAFVDGRSHCASACFLIWVAAVDRWAMPDKLGIHRPFYDPKGFADLNAEDAAAAYNTVDRAVRAYLLEMGVPIKWIDKMFSISSQEVYWLSQTEILELSGRTPFYDEWLRAKCPNGLSSGEQSDRTLRSGSQNYLVFLEDKWKKHRACKEAALYDARTEVRSLIEDASSGDMSR